MQDLNSIIIIGRLTKDAELKTISTGTSVLNLSIANNESRKSDATWEEYANFFDVTVWGKQAESLAQYLLKGKQIAVEGRLHQDRWEAEGQKHNRVKIKAQSIQLLGGGQKKEEAAPASNNPFDNEDPPF